MIQAGQIGRGRGDLEGSPLDHHLRGQDNGAVPRAHGNLLAPPQQKAEIGAGQHRASRAGWNLMYVYPVNAPSDPGTDVARLTAVPEEVAQGDIG